MSDREFFLLGRARRRAGFPVAVPAELERMELTMIITCPQCNTRYSLEDEKIRPGLKLRCTVCKHVFALEEPADPVQVLSDPVPALPKTPLKPVEKKRHPFRNFLLTLILLGGAVACVWQFTPWLDPYKPQVRQVLEQARVYETWDSVQSWTRDAYTRSLPVAQGWIRQIRGFFSQEEQTPAAPAPSPAAPSPSAAPSQSASGTDVSASNSTLSTSGTVLDAATRGALVSKLDLRDVRQYTVRNEKLGDLVVVQGQVLNNFADPRELIRLDGFLYGEKEGEILASRSQWAGPVITKEQAQTLDAAELESVLTNKHEIEKFNTRVAPGGQAPFTLVFYGPSVSQARNYKLQVVEARLPQ